MDISLILFIVVVAFFTYRGYRKGLLASLSRILSLLAGYIAAILYTEQVSALIEAEFQLRGIVAFISAAVLLFVGAGVGVSFLFWLLGKLVPGKEALSGLSSLGGALVGAVVGVVVAFAMVWCFSFARDMHPATFARMPSAPPQKSAVENLANQVASKAVDSAMSAVSAKPQVAKLSAALIKAPAETAQQVQRLTQSEDLRALLGDPVNQAVLNSGDSRAVQRLPAFRQLVKNPDMLALAASSGLLSNADDNPGAVEEALAGQVTDIWGRVQQVKNDARVQDILSDPQFQQNMQSGNPVALLTNSRLLELTEIVFSSDAEPGGGEVEKDVLQGGEQGRAPEAARKGTKIYRWTDENGQPHFSDAEPERR